MKNAELIDASFVVFVNLNVWKEMRYLKYVLLHFSFFYIQAVFQKKTQQRCMSLVINISNTGKFKQILTNEIYPQKCRLSLATLNFWPPQHMFLLVFGVKQVLLFTCMSIIILLVLTELKLTHTKRPSL